MLGAGEGAEPLRLFLGVGMLGGFTTFSAFSVEAMQMIQRGDAALAGAYMILSVTGAVVMSFLGFLTVRGFA